MVHSRAMTARDLILIARGRELVRSGRAAEIREAAGLSQVEVAKFCRVSPGAVSRWEAGLRVPRGQAAKKLGVLLGKDQLHLDEQTVEMRDVAADARMVHISEPVEEELGRLGVARSP
jgi:transcriptional regulator with XRE-family HTH domain